MTSFIPRPPSHSPHSHTSLTFSQTAYEKKVSLKLNYHNDIAPRRQQAFKTSECSQSSVCLGTSLRVYRISFAWSQLQQRERQWQRAYRRRPTALEAEEKTTETEARSSPATVYACTVPRWSIPGKIWMPTNQIRAISAGAHVSRE